MLQWYKVLIFRISECFSLGVSEVYVFPMAPGSSSRSVEPKVLDVVSREYGLKPFPDMPLADL